MKNIVTLVLCTLFALTLQGQSLLVNVQVSDSDGAPVEGVEVIALDSTSGMLATQITDADGHAEFSFPVTQNNAGDLFFIWMIDCNGNFQSATVEYTGGDQVVDLTFSYCAGGPDSTQCFVDIFVAPPMGQGWLLTAAGFGTEPLSYQWSNGEVGPSIIATAPGTYCVTMSDAANCIAEQCVVVDSFAVDTFCEVIIYPELSPNGLIGLFGQAFGIPPFSYEWSTGDTTEYIPIDPNVQTYCLTVTDAAGCEASSCVDATDFQFCEVWIGCDPAGTLTAYATGIPPFMYEWNTGDSTQSIDSDPGNEYCVTVTDAVGCEISSCLFVDTTNQQDTFCFAWIHVLPGDSSGFALTAEYLGMHPATYAWSDGSTGPTIQVPDQGTYCVTVTGADGCVAETCATVDSTTFPPCEVSVWVEYGPMGITLWAETWNTPPASYEWSTGETEPFIVVSDSAEYCVTVTDIFGCTATACVNPFVNTQCDVWLACDPPGTMTAQAYGVPPFQYEWNTGGTDMTIPTVVGETYCVTVTDALGCEASACMTVDSMPPFPDSCGVIIINNAGTPLGLLVAQPFGTPPFQIVWSDGTTGPVFTPPSAGTYCVTMSDANGCTATACIDVPAIPQCYACIDVAYNWQDTTAVLTAGCANTQGGTHAWSTGETGQSIVVDASGTYCVTSMYQTGTDSCIATACVFVDLAFPDSNLINTIQGSISSYTFVNVTIDGEVVLIREQADGTLAPIDTVAIEHDPAGGNWYSFDAQAPGTYYVKAIPDNSNPNIYFAPTYHIDAPFWVDATPIVLPHIGVPEFPIFVIPDQPMAGPGLITGMVTTGSGFDIGVNRNSEPFPNVSVFLTTATGEVLQHTQTAADGEFFFSSLPWGVYRLYVDHLNVEPYYVEVELTPGQPASGDILIHFDGVDFTTSIRNIADSDVLRLYPNPASEYLILEWNEGKGDRLLDLRTLDGRSMHRSIVEPGTQLTELDVSDWPAGIYILQVRDGNDVYFEKVMIGR